MVLSNAIIFISVLVCQQTWPFAFCRTRKFGACASTMEEEHYCRQEGF